MTARRLLFGGDYNPEQWDEDTWREDIRLMQEARVTTVTLGVFAWGFLEVDDDVWEWDWFDHVIGMLSHAGIGIALATPTAAPPTWLHRRHPEIIPVDRQGVRFHQGGRLGWCASHPVWHGYSTRVARRLGERYGRHPAVEMWHVGNEFGGGNRHCYCEESSTAFRAWLRARYGTIDALNRAWGTAVWGLRYRDFDDVIAPLASESGQSPSLLLAFDRFSSDALLAQYRRERGTLRDAGVRTPITTNLMLTVGGSVADYVDWVPELDVVAIDHYTQAADPHRERELAFVASRARGLDRSKPWLLMEHAPSAVNWQSRNRPKEPGEMTRHSIQHIAHGSDGALFFQWRASPSGVEQYHSGLVPHAGTRTRQWGEVVALGGILERISETAGSLVTPSAVAVVADIPAKWAWEEGQKPLNGYPLERAGRRWHEALAARGLVPDVVSPTADLSGYRLLVVPGMYAVDDDAADRIAGAAAAGATIVVGHLSGIVDAENRVRTGGYPGAFRTLLGVFGEELHPLLDGERMALASGAVAADWAERLRAVDADVIDTYRGGPLDGLPAVTRRRVGAGSAWYISADLDAGLGDLVDAVVADAGVRADVPVVPGVEAVRRERDGATWLFLVNHGGTDATVDATGVELVHGQEVRTSLTVAAGGVAVIRETAAAAR
ncbi:beta-galactosidase [Microbacterium terricola]|uniref:Beta-galactosidase n=1 Tax=Microbacterium terricola TaxID=344163 RepID=A0ABM8DWN6_9MICO|nr:beta-galactosidase [Microbacterium terricola]UYK39356.1 beta-galactosidase [Microbacterium terricola]BDV29920.1 beta-galactosidase [Microbacterium terricola]